MRGRHHDPERLATAALFAAKVAGCQCRPDITIDELGDDLYRARIAHDQDCRLLHECAARWN